MEEEKLNFVFNKGKSSIIKVIGVGGGGGNAVNHMFRQGIYNVDFIVCNTDNQALEDSPVQTKIQLGYDGLGAGGIPKVAREAAEESIDQIQQALSENTKMVFITAGMGGGTGTGAAPVVAEAAKKMDILTVGIVTIPFIFEGEEKINQALNGVDEMSKYVDALLVINNEKLCEIYPDLDMHEGFAKADDVLLNAAKGISEIVTINGYINVDFADVNTTMRGGGVAIMNSGYGAGEDRITKAIDDALNSPLLNNNNIYKAKKILLNIYTSKTNPVKMNNIGEITAFMKKMGKSIHVIWGATFDESLDDKVKITIIATGFGIDNIIEDTKKVIDFDDEEEEDDYHERSKSEPKTSEPTTSKHAHYDRFYEQKTKEQETVEPISVEDLDDEDYLNKIASKNQGQRNSGSRFRPSNLV